jgi:hypothetical protein
MVTLRLAVRRPGAVADGIHYPRTYFACGYNRLQTDIAGQVVKNEDLVNFPTGSPFCFASPTRTGSTSKRPKSCRTARSSIYGAACAVGLNKIARFRFDPRDQRSDDDFYELIGDDNGVFGCMSLLACHYVCPKNLPLLMQIAFLRRKMIGVGWK